MKKITYYLFMLLFLVSCKKETENTFSIFEPGDMKTGRSDAYRDGQKWTATVYGRGGIQDKKKFGIYFFTYTESGDNREYFLLSEIPYKLGKTKIGIGNQPKDAIWSSYAVLADDGDVALGPVYQVSSESYLEITKLDTVTNQLEGTFTEMTLEPNVVNANFPKKVVFGKGTFNTVIEFK